MRRLLIAGLVCWMAVSAAACGRPEDGGAATLEPQPLASQTGQAGETWDAEKPSADNVETKTTGTGTPETKTSGMGTPETTVSEAKPQDPAAEHETVKAQEGTLPEAGAYAGTYVDTYGTTDVYSELELDYQGDGVYQTMIGIYRLTTLDGTAREEGDRLLFQSDSESPAVQGEITFGEEGAVFTVTASEFSYLAPGDEIAFPTKQ